MSKKPIICVCSSASFYKHVVELYEQLTKMGYEVLIPSNAWEMKRNNDYEVSHYKTWFADANDYHKKAGFIRGHFEEIAKSDAVLIVNDEKHDVPNYIGGNTLMEMGLAFYFKQPIFIYNSIPEDSSFVEEIKGFLPIILEGDLHKIKTKLPIT